MTMPLSDKMLDELAQIAELVKYNEKEYLFRRGDKADRYFFLLQGKVLIEEPISDDVTVSVNAVATGHSVGWTSMLDGEEPYASDAICSEPTQLISFDTDKLKALFKQDFELGYIMIRQLLRAVRTRYVTLTGKFIQAIKNHPEMGALL